jgi:DNA-directed RNA polymerase specialized sigma subunit
MGIEEAILKEVSEQSLEQGIEQGIEQKQRTVTIRSYKKGMPVTDIADITELTVEEVEQIIAAYRAEQQA